MPCDSDATLRIFSGPSRPEPIRFSRFSFVPRATPFLWVAQDTNRRRRKSVRLAERTRRFEFVPLWNLKVFFVYARRRLQCPRCGVKVEHLPWAQGERRLTQAYAWFLATWAKRMSWTEVARTFNTSWDNVFRSVEMAVKWGRKHMDLDDIKAVGIDEILLHTGHNYPHYGLSD